MSRSELNNMILMCLSAIIFLIVVSVLFYLFKTIRHNKNVDLSSGKLSIDKSNKKPEEKKSAFKLDKVSLKFKELPDNELIVENPIDDHNLNFFDDFEEREYEDFHITPEGKVTNIKKSFKDFRKLSK